MRKLFHTFYLVLFVSIGSACAPPITAPPCNQASDCPGALICENKICVSPPEKISPREETKPDQKEKPKEESVSEKKEGSEPTDASEKILSENNEPSDASEEVVVEEKVTEEVIVEEKIAEEILVISCAHGITRPCFTGDAKVQEIGLCRAGLEKCIDGTWSGFCENQILPTQEKCDGNDNDCDGVIDNGFDKDNDGYTTCGITSPNKEPDCNDNDNTIYPSAVEDCDGKDNDCNGQIDENLKKSCYSGASGTENIGECTQGTQICENGKWGSCKGEVAPATEICDSKDNDCNGQIDDAVGGCSCTPGDQRDCGKDLGTCQKGKQDCVNGQWETICKGDVAPSTEICDGKDNNCDGQIDETFSSLGQKCSVGKGECLETGTLVCSSDAQSTECSVKGKNPVAEVCDGKDNDCDGSIDEDFPSLNKTCSSGAGECSNVGKYVCSSDQKGVACDAKPKSSSVEICDGKDNDCDGQIDNGFANLGSTCTLGTGECSNVGKYVCASDQKNVVCDAKPKASSAEICDGKDNDCDGQIDNGFDKDADGYSSCKTAPTGKAVDCDDNDKLTYPGATETCDGKDNNCDGQIDEKIVEECYSGSSNTAGVGECKKGSRTCTNGTWSACTGEALPSTEICDGKDNDCNGQIDDTASVCVCTNGQTRECGTDVGECKKGTQTCNSGKWETTCQNSVEKTREICDGKDNDCDGQIDEDFSSLGKNCTEGVGECANKGTYVCNSAQTSVECSVKAKSSSREICDGKDNDCDGKIDEDFTKLGQTCIEGKGECEAKGIFVCSSDGSGEVCNAAVGSPSKEICDGKDNDCDGQIDEGFDVDNDGYTTCGNTSPNGKADCDDKDKTIYPSATEYCDGKDNDCDGQIDELYTSLGKSCSVGTGECKKTGVYVCSSSTSVGCNAVAGTPTTEVCDGKDNDCDGQIDEGSVCKPDLVIKSATWTETTSTYDSGKLGYGSNLTITLEIENKGKADSAASYVKISYLDSKTGTPYEMGEKYITSIKLGTTYTYTTTLAIPKEAIYGFRWIRFEVDSKSTIAEEDETNNVTDKLIGITGRPSFDMDVVGLYLASDYKTTKQATIMFRIINKGASAKGNLNENETIDVGFYFLKSQSIASTDTPFYTLKLTDRINAQDSYPTTWRTVTVTLPHLNTGYEYIGLYVDPDQRHQQVSTSLNKNYRKLDDLRADLSISSASITGYSSSTVAYQTNVDTEFVIKNGGSGSSENFYYSIYYKGNHLSERVLLYQKEYYALAANTSTSTIKVTVSLPKEIANGAGTLVFVADSTNIMPELSESNNERSVSFAANGLPDLSLPYFIKSTTGTPSSGDTLNFLVRVYNGGNASTAKSVVLLLTFSASGETTQTLYKGTVDLLSAKTSEYVTISITLPGKTNSSTPTLNTGTLSISVNGGNVEKESSYSNNSTTYSLNYYQYK